MQMRLTEFPKVRYTMMEYHLFDMLPKNGKPVDSNTLADARKKLGAWRAKPAQRHHGDDEPVDRQGEGQS